jgi:hypothetical protein
MIAQRVSAQVGILTPLVRDGQVCWPPGERRGYIARTTSAATTGPSLRRSDTGIPEVVE